MPLVFVAEATILLPSWPVFKPGYSGVTSFIGLPPSFGASFCCTAITDASGRQTLLKTRFVPNAYVALGLNLSKVS